MNPQPPFLPLTSAEGRACGIDQFDIILVTGDAYIDHPSFGTALIGRVLWDAGFSVGIIAQPDVKTERDFTALGRPRLFFGISSGNVDSMVNNLTPNLKRRSSDVYSPGGVPRRPDRATIVYANRVHAAYPGTPIVIGGIEASLRRFAHYDYWQDRVRQSILADAPATLLVYGMGERQMVEIARRLDAGEPARSLRDIPGTCMHHGSCRMAGRTAGGCRGDPGLFRGLFRQNRVCPGVCPPLPGTGPGPGADTCPAPPENRDRPEPPGPAPFCRRTRPYLRTAVLAPDTPLVPRARPGA